MLEEIRLGDIADFAGAVLGPIYFLLKEQITKIKGGSAPLFHWRPQIRPPQKNTAGDVQRHRRNALGHGTGW